MSGAGVTRSAIWKNQIRQLQHRLAVLTSNDGKMLLMSERVMDAIRNSPLKDSAGQKNLTEDFLRGWAGFYTSLRVTWNEISQDKAEAQVWQEHLENLTRIFPGSTGSRFRGGMEGLVSGAAETAGGGAPQALLMLGTGGYSALATNSARSLLLGRAATGLQMGLTGATGYGGAITHADRTAAELRELAHGIQIEFPEEAARLRAEADSIAQNRVMSAAGRALLDTVIDRILPEETLLLKPGSGSFIRRQATAHTRSGAENLTGATGGQLYDHAAYGDPIDAQQILQDTATGTMGTAPMVGVGAGRGRTDSGGTKALLNEGAHPATRKRIIDSDDTAAVAETTQHLNRVLPGLIHDKTVIFNNAEELLNSDYARRIPFTDEERAQMQSAEGFYDRRTGHTILIAGNVMLREGETPRQAFARVVLHERVGHDGLEYLIANNPRFSDRWKTLTARIQDSDLDGIAAESGYTKLAGNRNAKALEWMARQAENDPTLLQKPGLVRELWESLKEGLRSAFEAMGMTNLSDRDFDAEMRSLLHQARDQAIKGSGRIEVGGSHPDGTPKDRFAFSLPRRTDKPETWEGVKPGHSWKSSKRLLPKLKEQHPRLPIVNRGSFKKRWKG